MDTVGASTVIHDGIILILLSAVLLTAVVTDLRAQRIPNWLTFPALFLGIAYHTNHLGLKGTLFSLEGAGAGIALLIVPYLLGGMGAGDAKLMGAVGSFLGPKMVFAAFLGTALVGGIYAVLLLIRNGLLRGFAGRCRDALLAALISRQISSLPAGGAKEYPRLCYGLAIALGTFAALLAAQRPTFVSLFSL